MARLGLTLALCASLAACAAPTPFVASTAYVDIPPYIAAAEDPGDVEVIWGGSVVSIRDHGEGSEIIVLGYPLDRRQRPLVDAPTQGRFLVRTRHRLDRFDAPEGQFVTVRGRLIGSVDQYLGTRHERYPILVDAHWAVWKPGFRFEQSRWSVGVGVAL